MIEPYRYASGDEWGADPEKPLPPSQGSDLAGRARRSRTDKDWKTRPEALKRALLASDAQDRRDGYRQ